MTFDNGHPRAINAIDQRHAHRSTITLLFDSADAYYCLFIFCCCESTYEITTYHVGRKTQGRSHHRDYRAGWLVSDGAVAGEGVHGELFENNAQMTARSRIRDRSILQCCTASLSPFSV